MKDKFNRMKEKIANQLEIPTDVVMNLPRLTISANNEITIENHKGILSFEENNIKVNSTKGIISIDGKDFEVLFIGGSTLTISGEFKNVRYEGVEYRND